MHPAPRPQHCRVQTPANRGPNQGPQEGQSAAHHACPHPLCPPAPSTRPPLHPHPTSLFHTHTKPAGTWPDPKADQPVRLIRVHPAVRGRYCFPQRGGGSLHRAAPLCAVGGIPGAAAGGAPGAGQPGRGAGGGQAANQGLKECLKEDACVPRLQRAGLRRLQLSISLDFHTFGDLLGPGLSTCQALRHVLFWLPHARPAPCRARSLWWQTGPLAQPPAATCPSRQRSRRQSGRGGQRGQLMQTRTLQRCPPCLSNSPAHTL